MVEERLIWNHHFVSLGINVDGDIDHIYSLD